MSYKQKIVTSFLVGFGTTSGALTAIGIAGAVSRFFYNQFFKQSTRERFNQGISSTNEDKIEDEENTSKPDIQMNPMPYDGETLYTKYPSNVHPIQPLYDQDIEAFNSHRFPV